MNEDYTQVPYTEVRELVANNACIIDVREDDEYEESHIIGAKNIPLSQFRDRMDEVPKDKPVYVHCRSGQRSYNAALIMENAGYHNSISIAGGYMGVCYFEYFNDQTKSRDKIVTDYNFE